MHGKGQIISKWFLVSSISYKKTNERIWLYYYDTSSRLVFVHFLEEIEDTKKPFRNYLTFKTCIFHPKCIILSKNVSEGRRRIFSKYFKNDRTFPLWILFNYKKYWILKLSISLNNYIIRKINPFFSALALCKK